MNGSLPIGIDIGVSRIRLVLSILTAEGPRIAKAVAREIGDGIASSGPIHDRGYLSALLNEAHDELGSREKRCVIAVGEPEAFLRTVQFPPMSAFERERAGMFEAQRHIDYPIAQATVRLHSLDERRRYYLVGTVRTAILGARIKAVQAAGLKPIASDHESFALRRALPGFEAILDIGAERSTLHFSTEGSPMTLQSPSGGAHVTRAIERELGIDLASAEKRKRVLGTAGAGEAARADLVRELASMIDTASVRVPSLRRVGLVGNGSKLANLDADLQRAVDLLIETPVSPLLRSKAYSNDVVRAAAPDWNLAAGLSMWGLNLN